MLGDGFACIDLDHCLIDGAPNEAAAKFLEQYPGHHVEVSPSGDGLHIWGTDDERPGKIRAEHDGLTSSGTAESAHSPSPATSTDTGSSCRCNGFRRQGRSAALSLVQRLIVRRLEKTRFVLPSTAPPVPHLESERGGIGPITYGRAKTGVGGGDAPLRIRKSKCLFARFQPGVSHIGISPAESCADGCWCCCLSGSCGSCFGEFMVDFHLLQSRHMRCVLPGRVVTRL